MKPRAGSVEQREAAVGEGKRPRPDGAASRVAEPVTPQSSSVPGASRRARTWLLPTGMALVLAVVAVGASLAQHGIREGGRAAEVAGTVATARPTAPATPASTSASLAVPTTAGDGAHTAPTGARSRAAADAVAFATERGWRTGIAVVDLETGESLEAGDATALFPAESTVKLLLAAHLAVHGELAGVQDEATSMIEASDDAAADAVYEEAGGDDVVPWAQDYFHIEHLGEPPANGSGEWGSTQVTPLGMARLLAACAKDQQIGPWLLDHMGHLRAQAVDGTDQEFGLAVAAPGAPVKQGWGGDIPGLDAQSAPSVGLIDNRYAVAIYTLHEPYVDVVEAQGVVTAQAKLLLPDGHLPAE